MSLHASVQVERNGFSLDVQLTVSAGETVAVLGPNGAGKSTLMKAIVGLLSTSAGSLSVFGEAPGNGRARTSVLPGRAGLSPEAGG